MGELASQQVVAHRAKISVERLGGLNTRQRPGRAHHEMFGLSFIAAFSCPLDGGLGQP